MRALGQPENMGIEVTGLVDIADVNRDVFDSGNPRMLGIAMTFHRKCGALQYHAQLEKDGNPVETARERENFLHDCEILPQDAEITGFDFASAGFWLGL